MVGYDKYFLRLFLVSCVFWLILVLIVSFINFDLLIEFLERYIAPDGHIEAKYIAVLKFCSSPLYFFIIFVLTLNIFKFLKLFPIKLSIYLLIYFIIFFTHLIIHLNANNIFNQTMKEDDFLEWATAGVSILATIFFFFASAFGVRCAFFLGIFWLTFAMEEISWGQRILAIENPQFVEKYNYQKELNFHNFLNPIINYLYLIFFLTSASIFTSFRNARLFSSVYSLKSVSFIVHVADKYNISVLLIFCTLVSPKFFNLSEFLEQQLALIGLILSLTILKELKLKKLN